MDVIAQLLQDVSLPKMVRIRQRFPNPSVVDVPSAVHVAFGKEQAKVAWPKTGEIAVVVGSRGIRDIDKITRAVVMQLKDYGLRPFVVPGMGSHGGATALGQQQVLESLGVTEQSVGAEIRSSMDVVNVGSLKNGLPVFMDKFAYNADGIVVINRVKPHTAFRGTYESGIAKMIAIGLGKQKGAEACHKLGFGYMAQHIVEGARVSLATKRILCGVAVLENAYDHVAKIEVLPAVEILDREPALLEEAKRYMPRIPVDHIDVLVVDEIGKDISGDGMDPNITGRYPTPYASGGPDVKRICVRTLTKRTHGNANGLGVADTTTRRVYEAMDFAKTYPNALTSTVIEPVKLPMILDNDRLAIQAALKTSNVMDENTAYMVHIRSTLYLEEMRVSEALSRVLAGQSDIDLLSGPELWTFDEDGQLRDDLAWGQA